MAVLRMTMSHGRTGWRTDDGGAGIQIWTMDCMSDARGGTTGTHSLDRLSTALHLPIYDGKREGTMEGESLTRIRSRHGGTAARASKSPAVLANPPSY
jgi:hypothetical protein